MEPQHHTEKLLSDPKSTNITGYLSPFKHNDQPWLIQMPGNPHFWVAVFSDENKLEESCAELNIRDYKIKQITDGRDFLESFANYVKGCKTADAVLSR